MTIILVKLWQLIQMRAESTADVDAALGLWQKWDHSKAVNSRNTRRPISRVVALAMQGQLNATSRSVLLMIKVLS